MEFLVSRATAKAAKSIGFTERCNRCIVRMRTGDTYDSIDIETINLDKVYYVIMQPTITQLQTYLIERHKIFASVDLSHDGLFVPTVQKIDANKKTDKKLFEAKDSIVLALDTALHYACTLL